MHFLFIIMARETLSFTVQPKVGRWNILHTLPWGLNEVGSEDICFPTRKYIRPCIINVSICKKPYCFRWLCLLHQEGLAFEKHKPQNSFLRGFGENI